MTIRDERVVLDTNIWIFGLRRHPEFPGCVLLLERLSQLHVILPRQVLWELRANLTEGELRSLFRLVPGAGRDSLGEARKGDYSQISKSGL